MVVSVRWAAFILALCSITDAFQPNLFGARSSIRQFERRSSMLKSSKYDFDLVVIGAGPVGVRAAIVAASPPISKKVCLVDAPRFSGALMNEKLEEDLSIGGPTGLFSKALRDVSKRVSVNTLRGMGLREDSMWNEVTTSCVELATANARDMRRQLDLAGVEYREGLASFTGREEGPEKKPQLMVQLGSGKTSYMAPNHVLLATGSKPFQPPGIPFDGERIFDSDTINGLSYLPRSVAITGSGIIAIEYAKIFRNLGASVTLIIRDNNPRNALMKIGLDKDIAATLVADLLRSGIRFERGKQVKDFDVPDRNSVTRLPIKLTLEERASPENTSVLMCDAYIAAVGRTPCTTSLNLSFLKIETDEYGGILVKPDLSTTHPRVYAAGDILGRPFLASTGVTQGVAAVQAMFAPETLPPPCKEEDKLVDEDEDEEDKDDAVECMTELNLAGTGFDPKSLASNPFAFPVGIWSSPEAAWYGLTTAQAKEMNIDAKESIALYAECLRGQVFSPNGMLKLVSSPTGQIIGVHIVGDDACELIHYGMELVRGKRTLQDVIQNTYSAVTFHEMYRIAALAALDEAAARKRRAAAGKALAARNRATIAKDQ